MYSKSSSLKKVPTITSNPFAYELAGISPTYLAHAAQPQSSPLAVCHELTAYASCCNGLHSLCLLPRSGPGEDEYSIDRGDTVRDNCETNVG
jgi:hypothetical protein